MHFLGLAGLPRRYPDYADGYAGWNTLISYGSILTFLSIVLFLYIVSNKMMIEKKLVLCPSHYETY